MRIITFLIERPARRFAVWVKRHPFIAAIVAAVIWFLPSIAVLLYAATAKLFGETVGGIFVTSRWPAFIVILAVSALFPPAAPVLLLWGLLDLVKPDRIDTNPVAAVNDGIRGLFAKYFPGRAVVTTSGTATTQEEDPTAEDVGEDYVPPPNPVVGGELQVNQTIGVEGDEDFAGV